MDLGTKLLNVGRNIISATGDWFADFSAFFEKNWIWFVIIGVVLIAIIITIVAICVRSSKRKKAQAENNEDIQSGEFDKSLNSNIDANSSIYSYGNQSANSTQEESLFAFVPDEPKQAEPAKSDFAFVVDEPKQAEPAKSDFAFVVDEPKQAEPTKSDFAFVVDEPKQAEPAKSDFAFVVDEQVENNKIFDINGDADEEVQERNHTFTKKGVNSLIGEKGEETKQAQTKPAQAKPAPTKPAQEQEQKQEEVVPAKSTVQEKVAEEKTAVKTVKATPAKKTASSSDDKDEKEGNYRLVYDKENKEWVIKKENAKRAIRRVKTKEEALKIAKRLSENQDANLVVHKKNGKFQKL